MIAMKYFNRPESIVSFVRSARQEGKKDRKNKRNILINEPHHKLKEDGDKQPRKDEENKYED